MLPPLKSEEKNRHIQSTSSNPSEHSSIYQTAPFIQSSLRHCQTPTDLKLHGSSSLQANQVNKKTQALGDGSITVAADETTPLLSDEFKDSPTVHECDDTVNANEIVQKQPTVPGEQSREAAEELSSLLASSNALLNGGITSPATLSWLLKQLLDLYYKYPSFSHLIIFLTVLCIIAYFYLASYGELILRQASHIDLEELSVIGVSDIGVNVHVVTTIVFDYTQVSNWFNRLVGLSAGALLGTVLIKPLAPIDFFVELERFEDMHRLVRVIPPEMSIKLRNGDMTTLEFDTTVGVISTSAVIILNKLVSLRSSGQNYVNVSVAAAYTFDVESSIKNYKGVTYNIEQLLGIDLMQKLPDKVIESLSIVLDDKTPDILTAEISLETRTLNLPISLHIGSLTWGILLPLCHGDRLTQIGWVKTGDITIEPLSKISATATLEINHLPRLILEKCGDGSLSPLNQLLIGFLSGNISRNLYIVASSTGDGQLPIWLQFILERVNIPIPLGLDQLECLKVPFEDYIQSVEIADTSIELNERDETVFVSSIVRIILNYSSLFDNYRHFVLNRFMTVTNVAYQDSQFTKVSFDKWQSINLNYTEKAIIIDLKIDQLEVDILDSTITSQVLNNILSGKSTFVMANSSVNVDVESPVFDAVLYDLPLSIDMEIPKLNFDGGLSELNTSIVNIFLIESSVDSVTLLMDLDVQNPLEISIDTKDLPISLYFASENVKLGEIKTHDVPIIPSRGLFEASVLLDIRPKSFEDDDPVKSTTKLEKFLSSYLSGNETNITMIGHENSIPSFVNLSNALAGMSFDFSLPEAGPSNNGNGFIRSSTMHIMTSEIEFTIFNPIENSEVVIEIIKAQASFEGTTLGFLERQEKLIIPPGIYTTPRLPITYSSGIGGNILRKALNGDLQVHGDAIFKFSLDQFQLDLVYSGNGLTANVKL